MRIFYY
ncbi:hypothetical protein VTH06DRAFT_4639 [Thermothelomyces fergusii]